jgi:hypothetical protein
MTLEGRIPKLCWLGLMLTVIQAGQALGQALGQANSAKIAFLHLKMESNQVTLLSASVSPGVLKRLPDYRAAIDLEVANAAGQVLWANRVANPLIRRLEFEDPEHPGVILNKLVQLTNAEFTVRVPVLPGSHHVNLYAQQAAPGTNTAPAAPSVVNAKAPPRKRLGTVLLPQENK